MHFGFRSIAEAYGPLLGAHYNLVARIWNGEDLRPGMHGVCDQAVHSLACRRIVRCDPITLKLTLIPPANAVRAAEGN